MNFSGAQPSVFEGGAFDFAFFVCRVSVKTIQSTPQPFNPHFRPFAANHLAKPYFHSILPRDRRSRLLFQVPYAVTPVFAILTKTAGVVGVCFPFWKTLRPRRREVAFSFKFFLFTFLRTIF